MSRCCTNLMQLGVALVVCRDQHRGRYPRLDRLLTELNRSGVITLSSLFGCPVCGREPTAKQLKAHDRKALGYTWTAYPIHTFGGQRSGPMVWDR